MKRILILVAALVALSGSVTLYEIGEGSITLDKLAPEVLAQLGGTGSTADEPDTLIIPIAWSVGRLGGATTAGSSTWGGYTYDDTNTDAIRGGLTFPYPFGDRNTMRIETFWITTNSPSPGDKMRLAVSYFFTYADWEEWNGLQVEYQESVTWDDTNANGRIGTWTVDLTDPISTLDPDDFVMKLYVTRYGGHVDDTLTGDAHWVGGRILVWKE
jgi:hypothetical protein